MNWILVALAGYLLIQFGISLWVSKKISNEEDFLLAGRRLGVGLASISIFATWFGAETCMGSSAAIAEEGLAGSRADPFGYSVCLILMAIFLASQLWKKKLTTLVDLYRLRYGVTVERMAVFIMVPTSLIWAAAQVRAFGQIISSVSSIEVELAVGFATLLVIAYTWIGGLLGDVLTDFVQGLVLIVGLFLILFFAVDEVGGFWAAVHSIRPESLSFTTEGESFLVRLDTWMIPILGSLVSQELVSRILACKSAGIAKKASFSAASIYILIGLVPVFLGLLGHHFELGLSDRDQYLPMLAAELLPFGLMVLFLGALVSAILSTVDSTLIGVSALVSHNIINPVFKIQDSKKKLSAARSTVAILGIFTYFIAFHGESIYSLLELASSFGSAGILTITFTALYYKKGGAFASAVCLGVGVVALPIGENLLGWQAPYISTVICAIASFFIVSFFEEKYKVRLKILAQKFI